MVKDNRKTIEEDSMETLGNYFDNRESEGREVKTFSPVPPILIYVLSFSLPPWTVLLTMPKKDSESDSISYEFRYYEKIGLLKPALQETLITIYKRYVNNGSIDTYNLEQYELQIYNFLNWYNNFFIGECVAEWYEKTESSGIHPMGSNAQYNFTLLKLGLDGVTMDVLKDLWG